MGGIGAEEHLPSSSGVPGEDGSMLPSGHFVGAIGAKTRMARTSLVRDSVCTTKRNTFARSTQPSQDFQKLGSEVAKA